MNAEYQLLANWVLIERKCVTFPYLLRHSELNVVQAQSLFEHFLFENAANSDVSASYFVVGSKGDSDDDGIERKRTAICRAVDLAATKARFRHVSSCSVYSVQATSLTDFNTLFNANWLDVQLYLSPTREKTLFRNQLAINTYQRWKESHKDEEKRLEQASVRSIFADKIKSDAKSQADQRTAKKIDQLFVKSVKTTESSPEKKRSTLSYSPKTWKREIEVDDESDDEVKKPDEERVDNDEKAGPAAKALPIGAAIAIDDVFFTRENDESSSKKWQPTAMDAEEAVGTASAPKSLSTIASKLTAKRQRRAPKGRGAKITANSSGSDTEMEIDDESALPRSIFDKSAGAVSSVDKRYEKMVNTFVDDDGFEVTEMVTKEVDDELTSGKAEDATKQSVDPPKAAAKLSSPKKTPKSAVLKPSNGAKPAASSSLKKKPAPVAGQAKISSFFKKA